MKLLENLKSHFQKTRQDMKGMTFREKVDHLWTYYKEYAFVVIMVIIIVGGVIISLLTPVPTLVSSGTLVNVSLTLEGHDYLTDTFYEEVLGSPEGKVALTTSDHSDEDTVDAVDSSYQAFMGVSAKVEARELDYMLLNQVGMNFYGSEDILMDLRELLTPEELDQLHAQELLVFAVTVDWDPEVATETFDLHTDPYHLPVAINLTGTAFAADAIQTDMPVYLAFITNTPNFEACQQLWEHIKNWESKE